MKRFAKLITLILVVAIIMTLGISGCKKEEVPKELTVYVWEGYLTQELEEEFEKETGLELNVVFSSDNDTMITLLKAGGTADLIMPTQNQVNRLYEDDLAQPLDLDKIPNYSNISDSFKDQEWSMWDGTKMGAGDTYVIPYVFGTSGLVVNTDKYSGSVEGLGWDILFDPELQGRVSSRNSAESIMICLDLLGIPRQDLIDDSDATLEAARDKVLDLKDNVLKFYETGAELLDLLKNEEVWVSHIWDGGARKLAAENDKFVYVLPETGGLGWTDTFMIPESAANPEGAHMLIDFMLKKEVAAQITSAGGYTTTVKGSIDMAEGIDKGLYQFSDTEISELVWQLNFPQEVVDAYTSFWEEISTVQ